MKAVFVGGGAHRMIGILRCALAQPGLLADGAVHLHDLDVARAETVGRMAQALLAYPVRLYSKPARSLYRDLLRINENEIPPALTRAAEYL